jgi:mannose-1-phosphate guanylyltransferase
MRALILSAGMGERLKPITSRWAKPAVPFLNVPMISFPIYWLETTGLKDLVINTHYLPQTVKTAVEQLTKTSDYRVHYLHETEILGSGGGIQNARSVLEDNDDFMVANADGVVLFPHLQVLEDMVTFHKKYKALATLLVCPLEGMGTRLPGVWVNPFDEVSHFGRDVDNPTLSSRPDMKCLHFASYMILSPKIWPYLPQGPSNILYDVLAPLIKHGERVLAYNVPDMKWFETGNQTDFLKATGECIKALSQDENLGRGVSGVLDQFDPTWRTRARILPGSFSLIGEGANIAANMKVKDFAVIGAGTTVAPGVTLERTVLLPGAVIENSTRGTVIFD